MSFVLESEQAMENKLIKQLQGLGYEKVVIRDEQGLKANLKLQIEKHNAKELNGVALSQSEFDLVLNHLSKGDIFDKAHRLREKMHLERDDGTDAYLEFVNQKEWCKNQFQVTHQVTMEGRYENRYDVTLLINGLPLCQIELKRRGLELKEAFNQTHRYDKHSYGAGHGLFQYIQIFVISNGVNTKYYANNRKQSFKQTFYWSDVDNNPITNLEDFAEAFLEKCRLSKMIMQYIVLHESDKCLMVLRPYQYYAVEAIVDKVRFGGVSNGYIWHTTGSGKTLTSFKASQIIRNLPNVYKVVFVVDRRDLDYQTSKEFNSFSKGSVDGTDNTKKLVEQFQDPRSNLIVTTIQKLNTAIGKARYQDAMASAKNKRVVFIFDECHRSQFGETHNRIKNFFTNHQMFGFTGTPIFEENVTKNQFGKRTTKDLFEQCLHKYVITDAIRDANVLRFSVEYLQTMKSKGDIESDEEVLNIDREEALMAPARLTQVADHLLSTFKRKTHNGEFTAMFCVGSVEMLTQYYDLLREKKVAGEHNLRVATIFSFAANEDDAGADGLLGDEDVSVDGPLVNLHSRDRLESYIGDYNEMFGTSFTTRDSKSFYDYYNDIARKVKDRKIDLLLVVNMFLTGFDSKTLNTLYVDKPLQYHGLIQAYSRTNRILNEKKSQGNIVCYRPLKSATDTALALFANKNAREQVFVQPYEEYVEEFIEGVEALKAVAPSVDSVNQLKTEEQKEQFVKAFRNLMRLKNTLSTFSDFTFEDLGMSEQLFADYQSKYLDLYESIKGSMEGEKVSILDDIDFEIELIRRDDITVGYILSLLGDLHEDPSEESREGRRKSVLDLMSGDPRLRSKRELLESFIRSELPLIEDRDDIESTFYQYLDKQREIAREKLIEEHGLKKDEGGQLIEEFIYTGKEPTRNQVHNALEVKVGIRQRKTVAAKIKEALERFVATFFD